MIITNYIVLSFYILNFQITDSQESVEETMAEDSRRIQWSRKDNLRLIGLYKDHINQFKSTTIRNDKVWQSIAIKMVPYTADQCRNKFTSRNRK